MLIVAPLSANTMAKLAYGLCDNLVVRASSKLYIQARDIIPSVMIQLPFVNKPTIIFESSEQTNT